MSMTIPTVKLHNGKDIPAIGFGCAFGSWTGGDAMQGFNPEDSWRALTLALEAGFAHFDTAHCYGTERHLGDVLGRALAEGRIERKDVFVSTKEAHPASPPHIAISRLLTWNWNEVPDLQQRVRDDFERSKEKLGMGYVDQLLMHWPGSFNNTDRGFAREARIAIWEVFEDFLERGDVHAIGLCNATPDHLADIIDAGRTVPMLNQFELSPYCQDREILQYCQANNIVVAAYAPFASGAFGLFQDSTLTRIANELEVSVGQVILRWILQQGFVALPKSTNAKRMAENLDVFGFTLGEEHMQQIAGLAPSEPKRSTANPYDII